MNISGLLQATAFDTESNNTHIRKLRPGKGHEDPGPGVRGGERIEI
jgi:hypothetical protein